MPRVPAFGRNRSAGAVAVDFNPGLEQRISQSERNRLPDPFHRKDMQTRPARGEVHSASFGDFDEQVQVRLPMLNHALPYRPISGRNGFDAQSHAGADLSREIGERELNMRADRLSLAQTM